MPETFGAVGNDLRVWYKDKDGGYSYASQSDDLAQISLGTELRLQTGEESQLLASFQTIEETDQTGKKVTDTQDVNMLHRFYNAFCRKKPSLHEIDA